MVCDILAAFNAGMAYCLRLNIALSPVPMDNDTLNTYLMGTMGHCLWPQVRLLHLDSHGCLLHDETLRGENRRADKPTCREVIARALHHGASALVVAYGHADKSDEPSLSQTTFALRLDRIARELGLELRDQIIVTGSKCISLRAQGIFEAAPEGDLLDEEMEQALDVVVKRLRSKRAKLMETDRERLVGLAKDLYKARRARDRYFAGMIDLGEPSWDLLIDLYIASEGSKSISVSSACVAASVPTTTAMRRIEKLEKNGILERQPDPIDGRRSNLILSPSVKAAMEDYLLSLTLR